MVSEFGECIVPLDISYILTLAFEGREAYKSRYCVFFLTKENTHSVNRKKWCLFETTHTIVNNYNFKHFILIKHFSKRTQLQLNQSMMVMMMNATVGQHFYLHKETNACSWKSHIELIKHMWCSHFADSLHLANSSYSQFLSGENLILSQFWMISSN